MFRHKATSYALAAMIELARHEESGQGGEVSAGLIAERHGLPVSYTAKILAQLARSNLLRSGRGPHGGYSLALPTGKVSVLDILRAVGAFQEGGITLPEQISGNVQTHLDGALDLALAKVHDVLAGVTLADLMRGEAPSSGSASASHPSRASR